MGNAHFERALPSERETYAVRCLCSNCGYVGNLSIQKGVRAPGGEIGSQPAMCPVCGCRAYTRKL